MKIMTLALSVAALAGSCAFALTTPVQAADDTHTCPAWRCGFNGTSLNGITINGWQLNGLTLNGLTLNGTTLNGPVLQGIDLNGTTLNGPVLQGVQFNGAAAPIDICEPKTPKQICHPGLRAVILPGGERVQLR